MSASRIKTLFFIGLLVGSLGVSFAATFPTSQDVAISDGITVESPTGTEVKVWGDTNMTMEDMFRGTNDREVHVTTENGNITIASSNSVHAEVFPGQNLTGTWTNVSRISAGGNWLEIYPVDKQRVDVKGDTDDLSIRDMAVDDGQTDFVINGTNGGTATLKIYNLPADTRIVAIDPNTQNVLGGNDTTANGVLQIDLSLSEHTVELRSDTGSTRPDLSNPQPEGGQSAAPSQLSIDVVDADFPTDQVDVTFYLDGNQVGTDTVDSAGTASTSISNPTLGSHDVSVEATDAYGNTAVENWTFKIPNTLYLRNETQPSQLITENTTVRFYEFDGDYIFERTTSNGKIDLTGLNTTSFIATARPADDYGNRTIYLPNIYEQQAVYLLNTTAYSTVENRFVLNDPTGQYGSQSILVITRGINNTFTRIVADKFGAEGVTTTLQQNVRYRLRVKNEGGQSQSIGPYRGDVSETVEVVPGEPSVPLQGSGDGWSSGAGLENRTLEYRYADPENKTDQVTVWIHERNNESNQLTSNTTYFNLGNFSGQATLNENESEKTWVVKYIIERDGETFTKRHTLSNRPDILPPLAKEWTWIPAIFALFLIAGSFSVLNVAVGSVITSLVGGIFWWLGLLNGPATAAGVALAIFLSVMYHMYSTSGP